MKLFTTSTDRKMNNTGSRLPALCKKISLQLFLLITAFFMLLPIFWALITSFQPKELVNKYPPVITPAGFESTNYIRAFSSQPMVRYIFNSFFISVLSVLLCILISIASAYAFSRYKFAGKKLFIFIILFPMLIPGVTNLIPLYSIVSKLRLLNNYGTLVFLLVPLILPISIWIMKNFFDAVPYELEESAKIDGCGTIGTMVNIIIPISVPGIVSIGIMNFIAAWNDFLNALLFTSEKNMRTITVGIYNFINFVGIDYGALNAATVVSILPVIAIFLVLRTRFMNAIVEGAVKG